MSVDDSMGDFGDGSSGSSDEFLSSLMWKNENFNNLTKRQTKFLTYIKNFISENGYAPSYREIAIGMELSSTASVKTMLDRLECKGVISKHSFSARSLTLNRDEGVPVLGRIKAGVPVLAEENIEGFIPVNEFLKNANGGFFLIVDGDSMKDLGIVDGDFVFIQPSKEISNGQIGAFRINNEVTLKTFIKNGTDIRLRAANSDYKDIIISGDDTFEVIGRFVMLCRFNELSYKFYDRR